MNENEKNNAAPMGEQNTNTNPADSNVDKSKETPQNTQNAPASDFMNDPTVLYRILKKRFKKAYRTL